jgi:hypothetical protein
MVGMSDALRTGKLLRERTYLMIKNPHGPNTDVAKIAPAETPIWWTGGSNAGHEDSYGGRHLHWIDLPEYGHSIGAELGIDFEWDDAS